MARKKIYDVMPPSEARKVEDTIKSLGTKEAKKKRTARTTKSSKKEVTPPIILPQMPTKVRGRFPSREILVGCLIVVLLFGIYFFNKLPKAKIEILPKLEEIVLEDKITANKSISQVDVEKKLIPLEYIEETKEASQEFPATGIASNSGKATGTIIIYNKLSPAIPLTLVTGTHFLSDSGKYFITTSKITIPAMKGKTPGSINVKVQAEEVGSEYNIGPSTFSVPKLSGTPYYYGIWGESKEKMDGGYTGEVKKVTRDDLETAEDVLIEKLMKDAQDELRNKISDDEILLEDSIATEVVETLATVKPDAIADNFTQSAKVKISALVFKKQDTELYTKNVISSKLPDDKTLLESSLRLSYKTGIVDFSKGIEEITISATASAYYKMDISSLPDFLKRKSTAEIEQIISSQYKEKVSQTRVNFWPFWVNKSPKDVNRISVVLSFE